MVRSGLHRTKNFLVSDTLPLIRLYSGFNDYLYTVLRVGRISLFTFTFDVLYGRLRMYDRFEFYRWLELVTVATRCSPGTSVTPRAVDVFVKSIGYFDFYSEKGQWKEKIFSEMYIYLCIQRTSNKDRDFLILLDSQVIVLLSIYLLTCCVYSSTYLECLYYNSSFYMNSHTMVSFVRWECVRNIQWRLHICRVSVRTLVDDT